MTRLLLAFIVTDIHDKAQLDVKDLHFSAVYISGKICFNSEVICHNFLQELNQLFQRCSPRWYMFKIDDIRGGCSGVSL